MDIKTLKKLAKHVLHKTIPADFEKTGASPEEALRGEIQALMGENKYGWHRNKYDIFEILTEAMDETLPRDVLAQIGLFSDVRSVGNGERLRWEIKTGFQRAKQFVTRATPAGEYETFRLDRYELDLYAKTYAVAGRLDFERYLKGAENLMDIYEIIREGLVMRVYEEIQRTLMASWNDLRRPDANRVYANTFDPEAMVKLVTIAKSYGTSAVIYCTEEFASTMSNAIDFATNNPNVPQADLEDIRRQGYIGSFRGTPIKILQQSFTDETNSKTFMNPRFAYIIPTGKEKMIKVIFEGDTEFDEAGTRSYGTIVKAYKKFAVGLVASPNFWCMYYNSSIPDGGWDNSAVTNPNP